MENILTFNSVEDASSYLKSLYNKDLAISKIGLILRSAESANTRDGAPSVPVSYVVSSYALKEHSQHVCVAHDHPCLLQNRHNDFQKIVVCGTYERTFAAQKVFDARGLFVLAADYTIGHRNCKFYDTYGNVVRLVDRINYVVYDPVTKGLVLVDVNLYTSAERMSAERKFLKDMTLRRLHVSKKLFELYAQHMGKLIPNISYGLIIGISENHTHANHWRVDWNDNEALSATDAYDNMCSIQV